MRQRADLALDHDGCRFVFAMVGHQLQSVVVYPKPFSAVQYEKCVLRLGLFVNGFNGALVIEDARLFVPYRKSAWATHPNPPTYVPMFHYLLTECAIDFSQIERRSELPNDLRCPKLRK
jgi:hypothetical protein